MTVSATGALVHARRRASPLAVARGVWEAPLAAHFAVLLTAMIGFAAFIGVHTTFTDDEANVVLQAQAIEGGHWVLPVPFPRVDPTGRYYATENVSLTPAGVAPLAKHLIYTSLVAGALRLAGPAGAAALSIAGCLVAALCSAWLARLYAPKVERAAFWATGLASPLFFYGFVDTGQTIGAAGCAIAIALTIVFLRRGGIRSLLSVAVAMAVAATAREETVIYGIAAGIALVMVGVTHRRTFRPMTVRLIAAGLVLPAAGIGGRLADVLLGHRALGAGQAFSQEASSLLGGNSWLGQLRGFVIAAAGPGHGPDPFAHAAPVIFLVTVTAFAALGYGAALLRAKRVGPVAVALFLLATGLLVARAAYEANSPVAGILPAFPLLWVAIWALGRTDVRRPETAWVLLTTLIFSAGVGVSVYSDGGGLQWGGRYFLVALPAALPALLEALRRWSIPGHTRWGTAACLAVSSLAVTWQMGATLAATHRAGSIALAEIAQAADTAGAGDGGSPVVLTSSVAVGMLWSAEDRYRVLRPPATEMGSLGEKLRAAGVVRLVLATQQTTADEKALRGSYRVLSTLPHSPGLRDFTVAVLAAD
ncbi:MAG TPA: hypothetical protein VFP54_01495 [Acidimicrobiales bacterium]|nr:hypothetical protein [Acidimicrobiales bacterium]